MEGNSFVLFLVDEQRDVTCISDLPIRAGDLLSGVAKEEDGVFYFVSKPLVQIGKDKDTVVANIRQATGIRENRALDVYDKLALSGEASLISDVISHLAALRKTNPSLTIAGLSKGLSARLLVWYESQTSRQLELLGISPKDISKCQKRSDEVALSCFRDPYSVLGLSMAKAQEVSTIVGCNFSEEHKLRARISRKIFSGLVDSCWTGVPMATMARTFPGLLSHVEELRDYWGVVVDGDRMYLGYPLSVEKEVARNITDIALKPRTNVGEISWEDEDLTEEQRNAVVGALEYPLSVITGPPGTGKCLDPTTLVMMYSGEVRMAMAIAKGDRLMGPDGLPRVVKSVTFGTDNMYSIEPEHGSPFVCNTPHVLTLRGMAPEIWPFRDHWMVVFTHRGKAFVGEWKTIEAAEAFASRWDDVYDIPLDVYLLTKPVGYLFRAKLEEFGPYGSPVDRAELLCTMATFASHERSTKEIEAIAGSIGASVDFFDAGNGITKSIFRDGSRISFQVRPVGFGLYAGFEIDGDGRFLLGDGLVTHNTRVIKEIVSHLKREKKRHIVCSFTGKAVARLKKVLGDSSPTTIHRLLKGRSGEYRPKHVVIDEASTVTTELLYQLGRKIGWDYRLTLVGDKNQLQPIGWGCLFSEVIESGCAPIYTLEENHRSVLAVDGISATCRNMVDCANARRKFAFKEYDNFHISPVTRISEVMDLIKELFSSGVRADDVTIITPYNKHLGELNSGFQKIYNNEQVGETFRGIRWNVGDRVMFGENDYNRRIMNGEEGKIVDVSHTGVEVDFDGQRFWLYFRAMGENGISMIHHSFAITGHKYQGSENEFIVGYIPREDRNQVFLDWKFLNTLISRARLGVWLLGDVRQITEGANRLPKMRLDSLAMRIGKRAEEK